MDLDDKKKELEEEKERLRKDLDNEEEKTRELRKRKEKNHEEKKESILELQQYLNSVLRGTVKIKELEDPDNL
jgi:phosphoenolpyruvate-protein kinase (PTS system EI component)